MWGRGCKTKLEPLSKSSERFDPCQYFLFLACVLVEVFRGKDVERRFSMWETPLFLLGRTLLPGPCSWNFRTPRCPMFSPSHAFFNVLALPPLPHFFYQQHPSRFSALIYASFFGLRSVGAGCEREIEKRCSRPSQVPQNSQLFADPAPNAKSRWKRVLIAFGDPSYGLH